MRTDSYFVPLGIEAEFWGVDPQGYFTGGHSVSMTARELARPRATLSKRGTLGRPAANSGMVGGRLDIAAP